MAEVDSLEALVIDCLQDLAIGERASLDRWGALQGAAGRDLAEALRQHRTETQGQLHRLERIAAELRVEPSGPENLWMAGMLADAERDAATVTPGPLLDTALVGAWRKVEGAEAASYDTAAAVARALGREDHARAFAAGAEEERRQDQRLLALLPALAAEGR
jgi:ferritin-like metal-binding protein YciE